MAGPDLGRRLLGVLRSALAPAARPARRAAGSAGRAARPVLRVARRGEAARAATGGVRDLAGDLGSVEFGYRPRDDGRPDPGEVVWAWVPFDENDGRGKDRPVLVVGRSGDDLVGLLLSSQDHDRDADDEARFGRYWLDVGRGPWDSRGRPSEVRLDRLLGLDPAAVRREGAALPRGRFDEVVAAVRAHHRP
jgi:PemK-like, MazF-like toxin of type II toxin-antitoxin system